MRALAPLLAPLLLGCAADQGLSAFVDPASTWRLETLNGTPFPAPATIAFPAPGRVTGRAPCNGYSARQGAPYPWLEITALTSIKMACPQLAQENAFFAALSRATISEVAGGTLILSNEDGLEMVFKRQ